jgi:dihydropteroate synthase
MKGDPATMQQDVRYEDLIGDIFTEFESMLKRVRNAGIRDEKVILDPGIGFGKNVEQNLEIIRRLREFRSLGSPILIGTSRKGFIGSITGGQPDQRLEGSLASAIISVRNGANIVRVHDVLEMVRALAIVNAIENIKFKPYQP